MKNLVHTINEMQSILWQHLLTLIIIHLFFKNIFNKLKDIEYFLGCVAYSAMPGALATTILTAPEAATHWQVDVTGAAVQQLMNMVILSGSCACTRNLLKISFRHSPTWVTSCKDCIQSWAARLLQCSTSSHGGRSFGVAAMEWTKDAVEWTSSRHTLLTKAGWDTLYLCSILYLWCIQKYWIQSISDTDILCMILKYYLNISFSKDSSVNKLPITPFCHPFQQIIIYPLLSFSLRFLQQSISYYDCCTRLSNLRFWFHLPN